MTILQAIILGIVQGATEFLPISSSGHLVVVPHLLGWQLPEGEMFAFDVLVQYGTLLALIIYFWKDLWAIATSTVSALKRPNEYNKAEVRLGVLIILATLPAVAFGLLLKDSVNSAINDPHQTALYFLATALILLIGEWVGKRDKGIEELRWYDALIIGFFQLFALLPGISRSGSTITGGMTRSLERAAAARFSFLMAVPAFAGAGLIALLDLKDIPDLGQFLIPLLVAAATSAVVGYIVIHWLLRFLANRPLYVFSGYLVILSAVVFLFF